jgi:hypothetical protein
MQINYGDLLKKEIYINNTKDHLNIKEVIFSKKKKKHL